MQSLNISTESQQATDEQSEASTVAESQHTSAQLKSPESQSAEQQPDSNDADDWQKASSSHNAARKKKRKQQRRAAWTNKAEEQATPSSPLAPATPARPQPGGSAARDASAAQAQGSLPPSGAVTSATASTENIHASSQPSQATEQVFWNSSAEGIVRSEQSLSQPQVALKGENDAAEPEQASHAEQAHPNMATCSAHLDSETASDSASDDSADDQDQLSSHADSDEDASGSGDEEGQTEEASPSQSSVASVTADFAMQNVILQMGLRLVAPNGMRIRKLTRWVLRCSACFKITKVCCVILRCTHTSTTYIALLIH